MGGGHNIHDLRCNHMHGMLGGTFIPAASLPQHPSANNQAITAGYWHTHVFCSLIFL